MNTKYLLLILFLLMVIVGIYVFSSENNNIDDNTNMVLNLTLPENYKIVNQSKDSIQITNGVNDIMVYAVKGDYNTYVSKYSNKWDISKETFALNDSVTKTIAKNDNETISKYWFTKENENFQIQINDVYDDDELINNLINSVHLINN